MSEQIEESAVVWLESIFFVRPSLNAAFCIEAIYIRVPNHFQKRKDLMPENLKLDRGGSELHPLGRFLTVGVNEHAVEKTPEGADIACFMTRPELLANLQIKSSPVSRGVCKIIIRQ